MTSVLAQWSDPTVLVALITGVTTATATITASAVTGGRAVKAERERARHALEAERDRFERERGLRSEEAHRALIGEAAASVLRFAMTGRWILHVRLMGPSGPGRESLADLMDRFPDDALAALTALERLRGVLPAEAAVFAEELVATVDRVFVRVTSERAETGSAELVKADLDRGLRRLLRSLSGPEEGSGSPSVP
ncbi:hypothetical protein [Nocardiopsis lambiniae]|uniref:Uncharacterized protein n=1 Tax=Nocardiopsis lambiniae TaxID=3075539 RepID=A0ABU2MAR0_9ACTN|nr:hypothetical protein [Nocardiopsis sp. DSM 44743]MDT0329240.1 hypothetical protein [Nocardiopsis sp. DSM 44743]